MSQQENITETQKAIDRLWRQIEARLQRYWPVYSLSGFPDDEAKTLEVFRVGKLIHPADVHFNYERLRDIDEYRKSLQIYMRELDMGALLGMRGTDANPRAMCIWELERLHNAGHSLVGYTTFTDRPYQIMTGGNFDGADLRGVKRAHFKSCSLRGAKFNHSVEDNGYPYPPHFTFEDCDLTNASFAGAFLHVKAYRCDLTSVDFSNATLHRSLIKGCVMTNVVLDWTSPTEIGLSNQVIIGGDVNKPNLIVYAVYHRTASGAPRIMFKRGKYWGEAEGLLAGHRAVRGELSEFVTKATKSLIARNGG
jgi:uncharacterized protein YjbI with pentapeptide repeats